MRAEVTGWLEEQLSRASYLSVSSRGPNSKACNLHNSARCSIAPRQPQPDRSAHRQPSECSTRHQGRVETPNEILRKTIGPRCSYKREPSERARGVKPTRVTNIRRPSSMHFSRVVRRYLFAGSGVHLSPKFGVSVPTQAADACVPVLRRLLQPRIANLALTCIGACESRRPV